jgi:hypothetical protein
MFAGRLTKIEKEIFFFETLFELFSALLSFPFAAKIVWFSKIDQESS